MPEQSPQEFMEAMVRRRRTTTPAVVLDAPAFEVELLTRQEAETVVVPAVPALDQNDEPGWRAHVEQLVNAAKDVPSLRRRLHQDAVQTVLDLRPGERPGSPYLDRVLSANLSTTPSATRPFFMTAGIQEALVGLLIAQQVALDRSTLDAAVGCANPRLLERVLQAMDQQYHTTSWSLNDGNRSGVELLHLAARNRTSCIERTLGLLLERKAPLDHIGSNGVTALGEAVAVQNLPAVRALLQHGADVNLSGSGQNPPLFQAIDRSDAALIHLLLAAGARPVLPNGQTAIARAALHGGSFATLEILMSEGLDPFPRTSSDPTSARDTSLLDQLRERIAQRPSDQHLECLRRLENLCLRQTLEETPGLPLASLASIKERSRL